MAYWPLCEVRLIQKRTGTSAANAVSIGIGPVPPGKIWVLQAVSYYPSVAETQVISFEKFDGGNAYSVLNPVSMNLNPGTATCIEQGMELMLFPNEYLYARRIAFTAGSTMNLAIQFVEIDLPLYVYDEPQVVKRQTRALSSLRARLGGGGIGESAGSVTEPTTGGGGGGGGEPVV